MRIQRHFITWRAERTYPWVCWLEELLVAILPGCTPSWMRGLLHNKGGSSCCDSYNLAHQSSKQACFHDTNWDVLQSWGCCWIWENLRIVGDNDWIKEAIEDGSCVAVTDGSCIKQVHPELCANACILCSVWEAMDAWWGPLRRLVARQMCIGASCLGSCRYTSFFLLYSARSQHWRVKLSSTWIAMEL